MNPVIERLRPRAAVVAALCFACASAWGQAQSPREEALPDYAAVIGESLVTTDAVTGERRKLSAAEVDALAARRGIHRTADQRRRAAPVNRALQAMPATVEASVAEADVSSKGMARLSSIEEMTVTYSQRDADGGFHATHDPDDAGVDRDR